MNLTRLAFLKSWLAYAVVTLNGIAIVALVVSLVRMGLAIGHHEEFESRFFVCAVLQIVCIAFMLIRAVMRSMPKP